MKGPNSVMMTSPAATLINFSFIFSTSTHKLSIRFVKSHMQWADRGSESRTIVHRKHFFCSWTQQAYQDADPEKKWTRLWNDVKANCLLINENEKHPPHGSLKLSQRKIRAMQLVRHVSFKSASHLG